MVGGATGSPMGGVIAGGVVGCGAKTVKIGASDKRIKMTIAAMATKRNAGR